MRAPVNAVAVLTCALADDAAIAMNAITYKKVFIVLITLSRTTRRMPRQQADLIPPLRRA